MGSAHSEPVTEATRLAGVGVDAIEEEVGPDGPNAICIVTGLPNPPEGQPDSGIAGNYEGDEDLKREHLEQLLSDLIQAAEAVATTLDIDLAVGQFIEGEVRIWQK